MRRTQHNTVAVRVREPRCLSNCCTTVRVPYVNSLRFDCDIQQYIESSTVRVPSRQEAPYSLIFQHHDAAVRLQYEYVTSRRTTLRGQKTILCADARQAELQSRKMHTSYEELPAAGKRSINTKTTRSCAKARGSFIIIQAVLERGPANMFLWFDDLCRFFCCSLAPSRS